MSCALDDCGDPLCPVCSVPRRFPRPPAVELVDDRDAAGLRDDAPALNGTKPGRPSRDPRFIKRKRKVIIGR